jgi:glycine/D-amino acid oxidase-like deaminating enzyme
MKITGGVPGAWAARRVPVAEVRDAEVTIVGGGAIGCAVAYVLAGAGYRDIQVVEQGELAGATSGQAAGLVGQVRATKERCMLAMASVGVYSRIEQDTGYPADWRQTGSVRIAATAQRAAEFGALAVVARSAGLEVEFLTPARLAALCPMLDTTQVTAALWCPTDGYLQPHSLVTAYARAARDRGVTFATHTTVTGLRITGGVVRGVRTDRRAVATDMVINAAGPWAGAVASLAGQQLPIVPVRHATASLRRSQSNSYLSVRGSGGTLHGVGRSAGQAWQRESGFSCFGAGTYRRSATGKGSGMLILAVLVIALILGGLGFVLHVLWWIALVVLVLWLLGFLFRSAESSGRGRRRWYRW